MKRQWTDDELEAHCTLHSTELDLVGDSKSDHNLLGFAVLLKYFQYEGRFSSQKQDIPVAMTRHIAHQLGVATEALLTYDFDGRMFKNHRAAIRVFLEFRETTKQDEDELISWLCQKVMGEQQQEDALLTAAYQHYKEEHIEPPTPDLLSHLLHTARHRFDEQFCASIAQQLTPEVRARLDGLLTTTLPEESLSTETNREAPPDLAGTPPAQRSRSLWQSLKQDADQMSLEYTLEEIAKLERIEQLGLSATLFIQAPPKLLQQYRQRIVVEEIHEIRRHPDALRWTLLAAYCWLRRQEMIDTLVDLLLDMAHHLSTNAERRVEQAFVREIKKVSGKTNLLFRLAEAAIDQPDGTVRTVIFAVVPEQTLRDLVKEYKV